MEKTNLKAYAKINMVLDITAKRDDGYHLLKTVMQTVDLYDEISLTRRKKGIMINIDKPFLPADERNLAFKAAKLVKEKYRLQEGVLIDIKKHIPVGGGMAGGSTDAACVITGMNRLFDLRMTLEEMDALAIQIGADVPFCLRKGTYLAEGIGEKLTKLKAPPELDIVICAPAFPVSTAAAYQAFDQSPEKEHPDVDGFRNALSDGDTRSLCFCMGNSLEPIVEKAHGEIGAIRKLMESAGALRAMMSGSGSVVFGLFAEREDAEEAAEQLKQKINGAEVILTRFIGD